MEGSGRGKGKGGAEGRPEQKTSKRKNRMEIIVTFLAILDLVREGLCTLEQVDIFGDIELVHLGMEA